MLGLSRSYRLSRSGLKVDGVEFDLRRYPYLVDVIDDDHPHQVVLKGAQLGLTIAKTLQVIDRALHEYHRGVLYCFPTEADVGDFSRARFSRLRSENDLFRGSIQDTDSIGLRKVGGCYIYFRGANSTKRGKSIPCDEVVFDELDEMDPTMVDLIRHRLDGASPGERFSGRVSQFSTPTVPEYGVDAAYATSDQHQWHIRCSRCAKWCCLELDWPDCLWSGSAERDACYLCRHCREPLAVRGEDIDYEWVPAYPDREVRGRWISQLNSPTVPPRTIADDFDKATREGRLSDFYTNRLGMAYAETDAALTEDLILAACNPDVPRTVASDGPCAMGVDPGQRVFHWVAGEKLSQEFRQVVAFGTVATENELLDRMDALNVRVCVMDEMAETRTVRRMKERRPGRIFGCWYQREKMGSYAWDVRESQVKVGRTESLDDSHHRLVSKTTRLPRRDALLSDLLVPQLKNLARVVREERDTKRPVGVWVPRGTKNDHLRHALNYFEIAADRVAVARRITAAQTVPERDLRKQGRSWMSA